MVLAGNCARMQIPTSHAEKPSKRIRLHWLQVKRTTEMFSTVPKRLAVPRRFILKQAQQCNKKRKRVIWHIHRKPQLTTIITPHPSTAMIVAEETYHVKQTHTHWSTCPPSPYNNNMDINSIATLYTTPTCTAILRTEKRAHTRRDQTLVTIR